MRYALCVMSCKIRKQIAQNGSTYVSNYILTESDMDVGNCTQEVKGAIFRLKEMQWVALRYHSHLLDVFTYGYFFYHQ